MRQWNFMRAWLPWMFKLLTQLFAVGCDCARADKSASAISLLVLLAAISESTRRSVGVTPPDGSESGQQVRLARRA